MSETYQNAHLADDENLGNPYYGAQSLGGLGWYICLNLYQDYVAEVEGTFDLIEKC